MSCKNHHINVLLLPKIMKGSKMDLKELIWSICIILFVVMLIFHAYNTVVFTIGRMGIGSFGLFILAMVGFYFAISKDS